MFPVRYELHLYIHMYLLFRINLVFIGLKWTWAVSSEEQSKIQNDC
jgi:hypothetical protein